MADHQRGVKSGGSVTEKLVICLCLFILGPILVPIGVLMLGGGGKHISDPSFWRAFLLVFGSLTALFAVCVWACWDNLGSSLNSVKGRLDTIKPNQEADEQTV